MKKIRVFLLLTLSVVIMATACTRTVMIRAGHKAVHRKVHRTALREREPVLTEHRNLIGVKPVTPALKVREMEIRLPTAMGGSWNPWERIFPRG